MSGIHPASYVPALIERLYQVVAELEGHFPGRPFTPDGHLVGSIGEVLGAYKYGLTLLPCSTAGHDAVCSTGTLVQIKATQGERIGMRSPCEHLIVLRLLRNGIAEEVFNGPGRLAWAAAGRMQRNGQRSIGLAALRKLMQAVAPDKRLPEVDV